MSQVLAVQDAAAAVRRLQELGVSGAGGAGFPTYIKYSRSTPHLIINVQDSEPGYIKDKLILLAYPDLFREAVPVLKAVFGFERVTFGIKRIYREWYRHLSADLDLSFTNNQYWTGEAKRLAGEVLGVRVPTNRRTQDFGATVSCIETVYNIHRALVENRPVVDKIVQVYGDVNEPRIFRVPVGTFALDLLFRAGVDFGRVSAPIVISGGPMMGDEIDAGQYAVDKVTNDLFVTEQTFFQKRNALTPTWLATPSEIADQLGFGHCMDWHPGPDEIVDLCDQVQRVKIALQQTRVYGGPSRPVVEVGQWVERGQLIAEPHAPGWGLGLHASIAGRIEEVTDTYILIRQRRGFSARPLPRPTYTAEVDGREVTVPRQALHGPITQSRLQSAGALTVGRSELDGILFRILGQLHLALIEDDHDEGHSPDDVTVAIRHALTDVVSGHLPASFALDPLSRPEDLEVNFREVIVNRTLDILGWDRATFKPTYPTHYSYLMRYSDQIQEPLFNAAGLLAVLKADRRRFSGAEAYGNLAGLYLDHTSERLQGAAAEILGEGVAARPGSELPGRLLSWLDSLEAELRGALGRQEAVGPERRAQVLAFVAGRLQTARAAITAAKGGPLAIYSCLEVLLILERLFPAEVNRQ